MGGNDVYGVEYPLYTSDHMQSYARANLAHATAAKDAEIEALRAEVECFRSLEAEAAEFVELPIINRTAFTGENPYVGWRGLGQSLNEALDERDALRAEVERLTALTAVTMGVGRGDGSLFVHGDYDSIKAAQALVFRAERLAEALEMLLPFTEHDDSCGDHDTYNNAAVPSCGCGLDSAREHVCSLLYPTAAQEGDHEQND